MQIMSTDNPPVLSITQLNILNLLMEGYPQKEIPQILQKSLAYIKIETRLLTARLNAKTTLHAVIIALRLRIITLNHTNEIY